ncbi:hydrogenase nickel incorporation protein HypB [Nocardiopsis rhodophaea]|uniref:hydrogenase nickel incorporation protein HypB n=1 Tax=Nocardiopsis rhodophaea TaxID=280238 RepID=UPI0031D12EDC
MCATCGCSDPDGPRVTPVTRGGGPPRSEDGHAPAHGAACRHGHGHAHPRTSEAAPNQQQPHSHAATHGHGNGHPHGHPGEPMPEHEHAPAPATAWPTGGRGPRPDGSGAGAGSGGPSRTVLLEQQVLAKNDRIADDNRAWLRERRVLAVNLMSSPGAGKTTLLERTIRELGERVPASVVEGDQESLIDAERIRSTGCPVVQINTGAGCHLDAAMLASGLGELDPPPNSVVLIENVGNLVCPALFDLGEAYRVVIMSVTEGADKPLKYPHMFGAADLVLLSKVDLLPHLDFDAALFESGVCRANPRADILRVSATTGEGTGAWYDWLHQAVPAPAGR